MDSNTKQAFVRTAAARNRQAAEQGNVMWSAHAVAELVADRLARAEVELALTRARVIEDYPTRTRPLPDCLVLGHLADGEPIHAVTAIDVDHDRILIVTVYRPGTEEWQDDWCTRRS
jgi:hypothetical protein